RPFVLLGVGHVSGCRHKRVELGVRDRVLADCERIEEELVYRTLAVAGIRELGFVAHEERATGQVNQIVAHARRLELSPIRAAWLRPWRSAPARPARAHPARRA